MERLLMTALFAPGAVAYTLPRLTRSAVAAAVVVMALTSLSGCAPLVLGGAAVGGALVAADRRTSGAQLEDEGIELRAANRLRELGERAHINVTSYNRQALLTGEVPTDAARQQAEAIVARVENVRAVVNDLAVAAPSTLGQRSTDALITGRVKAAFVDAKDVQANAFKVVTERGAVYLMGRVTQAEAQRATEVARSQNGVQRVVRVFEFITDDELRRLQPASNTATTAPAASPAANR
jgi:osmotically-inducible protein OsmY